MLSVVLAVRNEAEHIGAQLAALAGQRTDVPWELLVVDNGSTDGTTTAARMELRTWSPRHSPTSPTDDW